MKGTPLKDKIESSMGDIWTNVGLLTVMEQHLDILRRDPETIKVEVTPNEAEYYIGNFHGLLFAKNIPYQYHWIVTRLNGFDSSTDSKEMIDSFLIPSIDRVNRIKEVFLTTHNI